MRDFKRALKTCAAAIGVFLVAATSGTAQEQQTDTNRLALARELLRCRYQEAIDSHLRSALDNPDLAHAASNAVSVIDKVAPEYLERVAQAAARELTETELAQMLHLERSETIAHLRRRWRAVRPRLEDLSDAFVEAAADRFAEQFAANLAGRAEVSGASEHSAGKLGNPDQRGPLDTWAIHWLAFRPACPATGRQPDLDPLYQALASPQAEAATTNAHIRALRLNAEEGDEDSALALGCLHWLAEDFTAATNWLTRAAHRDSHGAQFLLGHALVAGWGVPKDVESGLCFLRAAAAQGLAQAQYKLATIYLEPDSAFSDKQKGLHWMKRAADNGVPEANHVLGNCLLAEQSTATHRKMAEKYLHRAAIAGLEEAYEDLVAYHMTWGNSDIAVRWLKKLINGGDLGAFHTLAVKYQNTGERTEAFRWWHKGAERGHRKSQLETARMFASGRGCERDIVAAEKWLIVAEAGEQERKRAYEGADPPSPEEVEKARELAEAIGKGLGAGEER